VKGMSGGPILGITQNDSGRWEYAGVAVQGSWRRPNRMLFGTPISILVDEILKLLPT
jgi:hypothetical protein